MFSATRCGVILLALMLSLGQIAVAEDRGQTEETPKRFLTVIAENDLYVSGGDRHYTNGVRWSYGFRKGRTSPLLNWLGNLLPLSVGKADREYEVSIGQNIYTPEDIGFPGPIPDDRPFAGWLYADLGVRAQKGNVEEGLALSLGVVGPFSLAEEAQTAIHQITNSIIPEGWDNQLRNEPALLIRYRRSWFVPLWQAHSGGLALDMVPRVGGNLGNVFIDAGTGINWRIGSFLPKRDTPLRIPNGLSGISSRFDYREGRALDWQFLFGGQVRGVARNIFLDGSTFRDSLSVDRLPFQWDAQMGLQLTFKLFSIPTSVALSHVWRSREFAEQIGRNRFGSISVSIAF